MELYTVLRQFADSWALLALTVFFLGVVVWVFRPTGRRGYEDAAQSIFRNEDQPAPAARDGQMKEASQ